MRRNFLKALMASPLAMAQSAKKKKFYITGFLHTKDFNDCTVAPIVAYGVGSYRRFNPLL